MMQHDVEAPSADARLIVEFANTLDIDEGTDSLVTRVDVADFMRATGVLTRRAAATEQDVALARELRSGIRRALELNHDGSHDGEPSSELDRALARLPLRVRWNSGSPALEPVEAGVRGALASIAAAVTAAHADGTWERLKICADDTCQWAYYDASKNRSKNWCGASCGNKAKTRSYRMRAKADAG